MNTSCRRRPVFEIDGLLVLLIEHGLRQPLARWGSAAIQPTVYVSLLSDVVIVTGENKTIRHLSMGIREGVV